MAVIFTVHTKLGPKPRKDDAFHWKAQSSNLSTHLFELSVRYVPSTLLGLKGNFLRKELFLNL